MVDNGMRTFLWGLSLAPEIHLFYETFSGDSRRWSRHCHLRDAGLGFITEVGELLQSQMTDKGKSKAQSKNKDVWILLPLKVIITYILFSLDNDEIELITRFPELSFSINCFYCNFFHLPSLWFAILLIPTRNGAKYSDLSLWMFS